MISEDIFCLSGKEKKNLDGGSHTDGPCSPSTGQLEASPFISASHHRGLAILSFVACFLVRETTAGDYDCSAKDDGWYFDPEFCHIYWRCIHRMSEEFECASGTAWDHRESRCNWLDTVDCARAEKTTTKASSDDEQEEERSSSTTVVNKSKKKKNSTRRMLDGDEQDDDEHERETTFERRPMPA